MEFTLECQKRAEDANPRALRRQGLLPAALYGHNGAESVSLTINGKEAETLLKNASVNNTLVNLKIPDISWNGKALIREVQAHPWKGTLYHLSFFSVAAQDSLEIVVPLHLVGEAIGAKEGGVLEHNMTQLNVSCAPDRIPESIEIEISNFEMGTNLHVRDLVVPEGVKVLDNPEQMVFSIVPPATAAPAVPEEGEEAEVEVIEQTAESVETEETEAAEAAE